jgi:hypothetical protein
VSGSLHQVTDEERAAVRPLVMGSVRNFVPWRL